MSFGFSVSDITSLVQLTTRTYQGWKRACGEYADITHDLSSLNIILSRVAFEVKSPTSLLLHHDHDLSRLREIATNCRGVVDQLATIVSKYDGIVLSRRNNWERIRFGQKNLDGIRDKLTLQITALGTYLDILGVSAIGRMDNKLDGLTEMRNVIDGLAAEIRAGRREGSVMTTYEDDEKEVWRQFRREMISEGFSSENFKKVRSHIRKYVKRMTEAGLLDEDVPKESEDDDRGPEDLTVTGLQEELPANFHQETELPNVYLQPTVATDHSDIGLSDPHNGANIGTQNFRGNDKQYHDLRGSRQTSENMEEIKGSKYEAYSPPEEPNSLSHSSRIWLSDQKYRALKYAHDDRYSNISHSGAHPGSPSNKWSPMRAAGLNPSDTAAYNKMVYTDQIDDVLSPKFASMRLHYLVSMAEQSRWYPETPHHERDDLPPSKPRTSFRSDGPSIISHDPDNHPRNAVPLSLRQSQEKASRLREQETTRQEGRAVGQSYSSDKTHNNEAPVQRKSKKTAKTPATISNTGRPMRASTRSRFGKSIRRAKVLPKLPEDGEYESDLDSGVVHMTIPSPSSSPPPSPRTPGFVGDQSFEKWDSDYKKTFILRQDRDPDGRRYSTDRFVYGPLPDSVMPRLIRLKLAETGDRRFLRHLDHYKHIRYKDMEFPTQRTYLFSGDATPS